MNIAMTKRVVSYLVKAILAKGCSISVYNGEAFETSYSTDHNHIIKNIWATDIDELYIYDANGVNVGWFFIVYGNDPEDLINDYSSNQFCNDIMKDFEQWISSGME